MKTQKLVYVQAQIIPSKIQGGSATISLQFKGDKQHVKQMQDIFKMGFDVKMDPAELLAINGFIPAHNPLVSFYKIME